MAGLVHLVQAGVRITSIDFVFVGARCLIVRLRMRGLGNLASGCEGQKRGRNHGQYRKQERPLQLETLLNSVLWLACWIKALQANRIAGKQESNPRKPCSFKNHAQGNECFPQSKLALAVSCTLIDYPLPPGWTKRSTGIMNRLSEFGPGPVLTASSVFPSCLIL